MTKINIDLSQLESNIAAFDEQLPILLKDNYGRYAVGRKGQKFVCFDNYTDALHHGYDSYGVDDGFLVREVLPKQKLHMITRLG